MIRQSTSNKFKYIFTFLAELIAYLKLVHRTIDSLPWCDLRDIESWTIFKFISMPYMSDFKCPLQKTDIQPGVLEDHPNPKKSRFHIQTTKMMGCAAKITIRALAFFNKTSLQVRNILKLLLCHGLIWNSISKKVIFVLLYYIWHKLQWPVPSLFRIE